VESKNFRKKKGLVGVPSPEFPCTKCVDADHCRPDMMFVDCAALDAYKKGVKRSG